MNCMPWWRFVFFNAAGAVVWATVYGVAADVFGEQVERFSRSLTVAVPIVASAAVIGSIWFVRRHEAALEAKAQRSLPGPLRSSRRHLAAKRGQIED